MEKEGRDVCYAAKLVRRYQGLPGWPNRFDEPAFFIERILTAVKWKDLTGTKRPDKPWLDGLPRIIFLNDMGDTFATILDMFWLEPYVEMMAESPHIWLIFTKQPQRMVRFFEKLGFVPDNFVLITSITSNATMWRGERLQEIRKFAPYATLGLSCEPILGDIGLPDDWQIDWLAAGYTSGRNAKPNELQWAENLMAWCQRTDTPFFFKQHGEFKGSERLGKKKSGRVLNGVSWSQMFGLKELRDV